MRGVEQCLPRARRSILRSGTSACVASLLAATLLGFVSLGASAQEQPDSPEDLLDSQDRLEELQEERQRLQEELARLADQAEDAEAELRNLERQLSASRSAMAEIELQIEAHKEESEAIERGLEESRQRLDTHQETLARRVREIYKRGPLHTVEVLLRADSFADLLNRYRYLHLMARNDQYLVNAVRTEHDEIRREAEAVASRQEELERLHRAQADEVAQLEALEAERAQALEAYRREKEQTQEELAAAGTNESLTALDELLEELEAGREDPGGPSMDPPGGSSLSSTYRGRLPWPLTGEATPAPGTDADAAPGLVIQAPQGEPVQAVQDGRVVLSGPMAGFGAVVVLSHGEGHYTYYLHLEDTGVVQGRSADQGQVVGTVGGQSTPRGPHLEFHLRVPDDDGVPVAVDPLEWLTPPDGSGDELQP